MEESSFAVLAVEVAVEVVTEGFVGFWNEKPPELETVLFVDGTRFDVDGDVKAFACASFVFPNVKPVAGDGICFGLVSVSSS